MENTTSGRAILVYPGRTQLLKTILPTSPAGLLLFPLLAYRRSKSIIARIAASITGLAFLFWLSIVVPILYQLLVPRPILVVDDNGIVYNPMLVWFVNFKLAINWEEIASVYLNELSVRVGQKTTTYRFLNIVPKDLEAFAERQNLISLRRFPILAVLSKTNAPFMIPETLLPFALDELLEKINERFPDKIHANDIEMREEQQTVIG